jgi:hypothetical protein
LSIGKPKVDGWSFLKQLEIINRKALLPLSKYLSAFLPFFFLLCPLKNKMEVELGIWFPIPFLNAHLMCKCATWGGLRFVPCFKERKA